MKTIKTWLVTIAALSCSLATSAHDFEVDGIYYNITSSTNLTVAVTYQGTSSSQYSNEYSGAVTIPSRVTYNDNTYSVTSIGGSAFSGCSSLTAITISPNITSIGEATFYNCSSLTSISIPENVTSIGDYAFYGCKGFTSITIPEGVMSIGDYAFAYCSSLTAITIPKSVTSIGWDAFFGCTGELIVNCNIPSASYADEGVFTGSEFIKVTIGEGVTSIGSSAFSGCSNLTSITIPESVTKIGGYAFNDCCSLTSITIPQSITSIGEATFYNCSSLTTITIPESVTSIGEWAFYACSNLTSLITIPKGVTKIGGYAFCGCNFTSIVVEVENPIYDSRNNCNAIIETGSNTLIVGCSSTVIPESVTSIGNNAFDNNSSGLISITIPKGVTKIGSSAFVNCSSLTTIVVEEENSVYDSRNGCNAIIETSSNTLIVGCSSTVIPESVANIEWGAFSGSGLTSIIIPEGVTRIESGTFAGCSNLISITIPESMTSIGKTAFDGCSSLTAITIPECVTYIGNYAFRDCSSLTAITIPKNVKNIGDYTFAGCSSLISITIPESVTSIGNETFNNCSSLTVITIPRGVTRIGEYAFANCNNLTSVTISEDITWNGARTLASAVVKPGLEDIPWIGRGAFFGCSNLTSITIPEGITSIEDRAFNNCTSLKKVVFENSNKTLSLGCNGDEKGLFHDCPLESIHLGRNLKYNTDILYGHSPFYNNTELTNVTIGESVTEIGKYFFSGCSKLAYITIPESVTTIGESAFEGTAWYNNQPDDVVYVNKVLYKYKGVMPGNTSIEVKEGITSIGECAFLNCGNLISITIPKSMITIDNSAFKGCSNLTIITCKSSIPPTIMSSLTFSDVNEWIPVYVPSESIEAYKNAYGWRKFTNIQAITKRDMTLLDDISCFVQRIDEECSSISYTRSFNNTNWQTLYVPFEFTVDEFLLEDFEIADINNVHQYDHNDDNITDETVIEAFKVTSGTLEANYPYLIRAKETGEKTIMVTDATLYTTEENYIDCSSVREKFTFTGTYSAISSDALVPGEGYYTLIDGEWQPVTEETTLGAFRFYLKVDSRNSHAMMARTIRMRIVGENGSDDDATGIEKSEIRNEKSEIIYDLQGRRVEKGTKGIYIVDGKKVVL